MQYSKNQSSVNNERKRWAAILPALSMITLMVMVLLSCDIGDFGDMNQDPTKSTDISPEFMLTTIQVAASGHSGSTQRQQFSYGGTIVQHVSSPIFPGEFYTLAVAGLSRYWVDTWGGGWKGQPKHLEDMLVKLRTLQENGEEVANKLAVTRIMRVYVYAQLTDTYGDIPYFEAAQGFHESEFTPRYDPQEEIYNDMFNELDEAVRQFDASQRTFGSADIVFDGDIAKWQKFANSLRLRLALRLVKVDETKAEQEALAAINAPGGVMTSNDDIYLVPHETGPSGEVHTNANAEFYRVRKPIYISQTLVNWLLSRNDPRLRIYGAVLKNDQVITDPAQQLGRPNGYTDGDLQDHPSWTGDLNDYTKLHPRFEDLTHPSIWFTYAEVEFMLAEVEVRWGGAPADAATHYNNGVRAAMEYLTLYPGDTDISDTEINDYLTNNPFNVGGTPEEQLAQIIEHYWAATFMNSWEAWIKFRASDYPDLEVAPVDDPNPHPQSVTGDGFPVRFIYPPDEQFLNTENFEEVLQRQGPNTMTTPVWWDVVN